MSDPLKGKSDVKSPKNQYEKRREQIRKAQRNHRKRKEDYVRSLEEEVIRLRELCNVSSRDRRLAPKPAIAFQHASSNIEKRHDCGTTAENNSFLSTFDPTRLANALDSNQAQRSHDGGAQFNTETFCSQLVVRATTLSQEMTSLKRLSSARGTETDPFDPYFASCALLRSRDSSRRVSQACAQEQDASPEQSSLSRTSSGIIEGELHNFLETCQIGTDFVLALERPCQALQMEERCCSDASECYAAARIVQTHQQDIPTSIHNSSPAPMLDLDRLLKLSLQLNLVGEVTPVQAWANTKRHPRYDELGKTGLETLKFGLMAEVRWSGFGAVIDQQVFDDTLENAFNMEEFKHEIHKNDAV